MVTVTTTRLLRSRCFSREFLGQVDPPQRIDVLEGHDAADSVRREGEHMQRVQTMLPVGSRRVQRHCGLPVGRRAYDCGIAEGAHACAKEGPGRRARVKPCDEGWHLEERVR